MAESREIKLIINGQAAEGSLNVLNKQARELQKVLNQLSPDDERVAEYSKALAETKRKIEDAKGAMGMLKKETSSFGDALGTITKGAFWLAIIQQIYEWAKAFANVGLEVGKLRGEINNLTGATGKELDEVTTRVTALGNVLGLEYNEVLDKANKISKQFGISLQESLGFIEQGFVQSGAKFGEKLQDLGEFPVQFREAGISAETYFKIVNQEIKGGVFDNKLQDAIKEVGLSLREFTKAQEDALTAAFGVDFTQKLKSEIDSGAITVEDAFVRIMTEAEKTGVSVSQLQTISSDVFKGAGEDVGGATEVWKQYNLAINASEEATTDAAKANKILLDSQKEVTAAQNELGKVLNTQSTSFQLFFNQGLAFGARTLTLVIEKLFGLLKVFYDLGGAIGDLFKSLGLVSEQTDVAGNALAVLSLALDTLLIPIRLIVALLTGIANGFNFVTTAVNSYIATSPALTGFFEKVGSFLRAIGSALGEVGEGFAQLFRMVGLIPDKKTVTIETIDKMAEDTKNKIPIKTPEQIEAEKKAEEEKKRLAEKAKEDRKKEIEDLKKFNEQKTKDEQTFLKLQEENRIKAIADEAERQKALLESKALQDAESVQKLLIDESKKAELRKAIAEQLNADLKAIDDKAAEEELIARTEAAKELAVMEIQAKQKAQQDALTGLQADVLAAENAEDPEAVFDAKMVLLQEQQAMELENLALTENQKYLILQEYTAKRKDLYDERAAQEQANANAIVGGLVENTTQFAKAAGEQTAIGKGLLAASKALAAGQIIMNSIIEVSNIFKGYSSLPIVGQVLGAIQAAVAVGRAAAAISSLSSIKFAKGGMLFGNSHSQGGVPINTPFGMVEAEGGEFITNKRATARNGRALNLINSFGSDVTFDVVPSVKYAFGGQLPTTTPATVLTQATPQIDNSQMFMALGDEIAGLRSDINNFEREKQVVLVYTDLERANADVTKIRSY